MEVSLQEINANILALRKLVEKLSEVILEDDLALSDEVVSEIEESRGRDVGEFVSQGDVEAEFL